MRDWLLVAVGVATFAVLLLGGAFTYGQLTDKVEHNEREIQSLNGKTDDLLAHMANLEGFLLQDGNARSRYTVIPRHEFE